MYYRNEVFWKDSSISANFPVGDRSAEWYPGFQRIFFLIDISRRSRVNESQSAEEKKITSGHRSTHPHFHARNQFRNWTGSPIGYSHVQLFDAANQGHCYIVNSLRTWEYPIGDPVQFLNWFLAWKWGCVLLWPEVIVFSSALCASLTRVRCEISIRKKYPLEPRVAEWLTDFETPANITVKRIQFGIIISHKLWKTMLAQA